ncbi:hypothetical protein ALNOE001_02320 [Candidatus Methanobinarius endosymbioticus]|uniref:Uncharacterized protein n=1 Tax=Candidatus Methanobinarius endosymbioticus TaxID=2006182 RepID=A0A366MDJ2_9EURY|nr:hypothetical protein ALNOE001_02320 [Candidatus Methanobinarius endosymbioticus]
MLILKPLFSLDQLKVSQEEGVYTTKYSTIGGSSGFESISNATTIKTFYFEKMLPL